MINSATISPPFWEQVIKNLQILDEDLDHLGIHAFTTISNQTLGFEYLVYFNNQEDLNYFKICIPYGHSVRLLLLDQKS